MITAERKVLMFQNKAIRYIFLVSIFIAILFPLINIFFIYPSFTALLIENTEYDAVRLGTHLTRIFFKGNKPLSSHEIRDHAGSLLKDFGLMKLKIFSPSGEIIYSTNPEDIGQMNNKDYFHHIVARGEPFTKIVKKDTRSLEEQTVSADVVETYVPIMAENRFIGAFEIYYDVTMKNQALSRVVMKSSIIPFALMCSFLLVVVLVLYKLDHSITERKLAEEALQKAHDELEQKVHERTKELVSSHEELQRFVYIASHDLQEPLRKVRTLGDIIKSRYAEIIGNQCSHYIERMQNATARMQTLINDLRIFSSLTIKEQPFVPVNLAGIVNEVASDMEARIEKTGGHVEVENISTIDADPVQMRQLLHNLIDNALKFQKNDKPPVIKVSGRLIHNNVNNSDSTASDDELYELTIEDNGIGFDRKYAERIFGVFQRLHGQNKYKGTGIGLSVCKKIVEKHGGSIMAESMPGEGAKFIVTLPVHHNGQKNSGQS